MKSRIAIILDRSSSMETIRGEAIAAFNEQIATIKKGAKEVDTKVSLFTFATGADAPLVWNQSPKGLKELNRESYVPNGMTAMYDSVGMAVNLLKGLPEANDLDTSFLVVIISDGEENNSKSFTSQTIAEAVKSLQGTNRWTFTYMGANQDLTKIQQKLNFQVGNMFSFAGTSAGMNYASAVNSAATQSYMSNVAQGNLASSNFYAGTGAQGAGQAVMGTVDGNHPNVTATAKNAGQ